MPETSDSHQYEYDAVVVGSGAALIGQTDPGPGATIGQAGVFGLIAARHLASSKASTG